MAARTAPETCPVCQGTGWKMLAAEAGAPARVTRCDCHFARRGAELLAAAQIPPRYQHCTLENFITEGARELMLAHRTAVSYSQEYPGGVDRDRNGLLFYGNVGTGKTHLAVAIAATLLERGIGCRFVDHRALLKQIQGTFDPSNAATERSVVQPLLEVEVLLLDDLGVGRATEWALETLHYILNHRYLHNLATVVTTNLEEADAGARATASRAMESTREPSGPVTLVEALGPRLRSRLYDMCVFVALHGSDFRRASAAPLVR
ncbi:MAG: ATP-binding protein [Terriglobales bacterium]